MTCKVVLVGAGIIALNHIQALQTINGVELAAIADVNMERAQHVAPHHGVHIYNDYKEMIVQEKPDLAVITLPHFLHREAVLFGAEIGCHMLLEKPMALNVRECNEMIEAVTRSGVKVMVGHTQHYMAANRFAKQLVERGDFGEMIMINDTRNGYYFAPRRPDWFLEKAKSGGGIVMNIGSHCIDRIQWLSGGPIKSVKASLSFRGERGDVEGSGLIFAENDHGIPAVISLNGYRGVSKNEYELLFTGGSIRVASSSVWVSHGGAYEQVSVPDQENPFVLQFRDMLNYIENGIEPCCSLHYARSVVAVVESIYRSQQSRTEQQVGCLMKEERVRL